MMARGYVLLIMLVYTQIFSLLSMQALSSLVYQQKISIHRLAAHELQRKALIVLTEIDHRPGNFCGINRMSSAAMLSRDLGWWRRRGCYLIRDNIQYFYVRETLEIDDCAVISNQYKQQLAVVYYRNTLLQLSPVNADIGMILQDTFAAASESAPACTIKLKHIKPGRQMWRWL